MSEQLPEYETGRAVEYLVHWHNGTDPTYSYVLADHILVSPETGVLYLHLARETVFFSQTWTSVLKSNKLPKE